MESSRRPASISQKSLHKYFLREVLAAGAGIKTGRHSLESLSALGREMRYSDFRDNLKTYFEALKPYRKFGDFQGLARLPLPSPLPLHVEPSILYGHFRAWHRKHRERISRER